MLNRLQRNQKELLRNRYAEHPLLLTAQWSMKQFESRMPTMRLSPEEIFCETADVLDLILVDLDNIADLLHTLWDDRVADYMDSTSGCSLADAQLATACVCYSVMGTLSFSSHWDYKYGILKRLMADVHLHYAGWKEFEDSILECVGKYGTELGQWLDEYLESEDYLSDHIAEVLEGEKGKKSSKAPATEDEDFEPIRDTFSMNLVMDGHIALVLTEMKKQKWVAKSVNVDDFLKLFSGKQNSFTYQWTASKGILKELFNQMLKKKYITSPEGIGYLQILQSHFVDSDEQYITGLKGGACGKKALPAIKACLDLLAIEL